MAAKTSLIVSKDIPDIEVSAHCIIFRKKIAIWKIAILNYCVILFLKNLLSLNPRSKPYASVVPSTQTKQNKQHWKRNIHSKCEVSVNPSRMRLTFSVLRIAVIICIDYGPYAALNHINAKMHFIIISPLIKLTVFNHYRGLSIAPVIKCVCLYR